MNTSKIIVRLDAEQRSAELEIMVPHSMPRMEGLATTLRQIGLRTTQSLDISTSRFRVTRMKLAERNGATMEQSRVMEILCAVREQESTSARFTSRAA
jgi:hypothetical protein